MPHIEKRQAAAAADLGAALDRLLILGLEQVGREDGKALRAIEAGLDSGAGAVKVVVWWRRRADFLFVIDGQEHELFSIAYGDLH